MKLKCFEVIDVETKQLMLQFAYEDIWYYNNYHVLGSVFVFPHYMKVTFFDSEDNGRGTFKVIDSQGVDFDWYKNEDPGQQNMQQSPGAHGTLGNLEPNFVTQAKHRTSEASGQIVQHSAIPSAQPANQFQKKFVILKDSDTICFDSGEGRIQVYKWRVERNETSDA